MIHQTVFTVHRFQKFTSILYSAVVPSRNGMYLKELRCELCNFLYLHEMILQSRSLALQDEACVSDFSLCGATSEAWSLKFLSEEKAV